jgi:aryl-alcohol dehydrogenase-like predicted oxidoreductase
MTDASRRTFLLSGIGAPALASTPHRPAPAAAETPKDPGLRFRTLGRTGLNVTSVGFGCMITSDGTVVERAADLGITYFDTARGYQNGNNERMVGAALKGKRKKLILSSKSHSATRQALLDDLDTSLRQLSTDYLDIWYLHAKSKPEQLTDELFEAQDVAKKQGKIRFAGVSTHGGQPELMPFLVKSGRVDVILTSYNFTMDPVMNALIDSAAKAGIGIVGMKVMAGGFRRVKPGDPLYPKFQREGIMPAALKWVLKNPNIHTTIPSITDMEQLDEDFKAMTAPFSKADEQLLARHLDYITPLYCRMCGNCAGSCKKGLPVSDIIRCLSYAEGYGQFALGRESYLELGASSRCADCDGCTVKCPNGVAVASRVSRAQECFA